MASGCVCSITVTGAGATPAIIAANSGTLQLNAFNSSVAFIGGTLVKNIIDEEKGAANAFFVSGNFYKDFAKNRQATFTSNTPGAAVESIDIDNLGGFGEASFGWNYIKILENGPGGASQLNTGIRLDTRFGKNVSDSVSLTAQVRLTF